MKKGRKEGCKKEEKRKKRYIEEKKVGWKKDGKRKE